MRNVIQLKKAAALGNGDYVLTPKNGMGLLLAVAVVSQEAIKGGKHVQIQTSDNLLHVIKAGDIVAVVI